MASGSAGVGWSLPAFAAVDGVVVGYALWTTAANLTVVAGGNARSLVCGLAAAAVAWPVLLGLVWCRAIWRADYARDLNDDPIMQDRAWQGERLPLLAAGAPLVALAVWLATGNAWLTWLTLAAATVLAFVVVIREPLIPTAEPYPPAWRRDRTALYVLAVACALFTLAAVRPRSDDALYLSFAVSVADFPDQPVLSELTLHGPPTDLLGPQHMFPPYKVHSFEVLAGALSYLTGIEAVSIVHFGLATLFGFLTPFALARLFRILTPRHWLIAVCAVVSFYMLEGSASRGYSNHALVRMFNGKSALLTVALPLICAYGLRFGAGPSIWRFTLLTASQIMAVGLSSTAIWLAPAFAMVSVAAATPRFSLLPRRLLGSVASSVYLLALAGWVLSQMHGGIVEVGEADESTAAAAIAAVPPAFAKLAEAMSIVLGPGHTTLALLALAFFAAPLSISPLARRLFASLALLVACGLGNPLLADWVTGHITGDGVYHRIFWLLPIPLALGVLCASLYGALVKRLAPAGALALTAAAGTAFYVLAVDRLVISDENASKLVLPPVLKLPPKARAVSAEVCKIAPPGTTVLASQSVMQQLPIHHRCGHPLIATDRYSVLASKKVWMAAPPVEIERRLKMVRYVDEPGDIEIEDAPAFLDALAHYKIGVVVLSNEANRNSRTKSLIRMAGYEHLGIVEWEHIYTRVQPARLAVFQRVVESVCKATTPDDAVLAPYSISRVLAKRACASALASVTRFRNAHRAEAEEILELERLVHLERDIAKDRVPWFEQTLTARKVRVVVLSPHAIANDRVRATLATLGFRKSRVIHNFTLYRRDLP